MTKAALLIGCNYSSLAPSVQLMGCIEDIVNVANVLVDAYGYDLIIVLRDDDSNAMPTKSAILKAIQELIANSVHYEEIWIHYSGHGIQIADKNTDEKDGLDEAIVPCDYLTNGFIIDDELRTLFAQTKCTTLCFFDCCHSGSVLDLPFSFLHQPNGPLLQVDNRTRTSQVIPFPIYLISGCQDDQSAKDTFNAFSRSAEGAFTGILLEMLRKHKHYVSLLTLFQDVSLQLRTKQLGQYSTLSSNVPDVNYVFKRTALPTKEIVFPSVQQPKAPSNETQTPPKAPSNETQALFKAPSNETQALSKAPSNETQAPPKAPSNETQAPPKAQSTPLPVTQAPLKAPSNEKQTPLKAQVIQNAPLPQQPNAIRPRISNFKKPITKMNFL